MELWTIGQVAEFFGVSASRARALLARHGVRRVSGYPADAVRAIRRPGRGYRTDLHEREWVAGREQGSAATEVQA